MSKNYSYSEINTGKKWINGKSIYRKVFQYSGSSTAPYVFNVDDLNIDMLLYADCLGHDKTNPNIKWLYRTVGSVWSRTIRLFKEENVIRAYGSGDFFPVTHLIIEYTKTTDTIAAAKNRVLA